MTTGWKLEGTDLRTLAYEIVDTSAWDSFPGKKAGNVPIAYSDTEHTDPRKWFAVRTLPLKVEFFRTNAAGNLPAGGAFEAIQTNIDTFLGLLYKRNGLLDLRKTVPTVGGGTHERQAMVEVVDFIPLEESLKMLREAIVQFRMPEVLWRQLETSGTHAPQKSAGLTGVTTTSANFNVVTGGNAPVRGGLEGAFEVVFDATSAITNPRIENALTGEFVQYAGTVAAGEQLVLDIGKKTAVVDGTTDVGGGVAKQHAWWLDLDPGATTQLTASVSVASDFDVTVKWYDRWF